MSNIQKNLKIKQTLCETKLRHKGMDIKSFSVKIDESSLSKSTKKNLSNLFLEAKWLINDIISSKDVFKYVPYGQVVVKKFNPETQKCDIPEVRPITIGSQIQQSIVKQKQRDIINLSRKSSKGMKIGKLKFAKEVNTVNFKQHGTTYRIKGNYITLQKVGTVKVRGLNQIPKNAELTEAKLIRKATGYFLRITCYISKVKVEPTKEPIGIDMGIKTDITCSDGTEYKVNLLIPDQLKVEQKRLSRKVKGSKNYIKQCKKLKRQHEKFTNVKNDISNKVFSNLKKHKLIVIQDENLKGWTCLFGKKIATSILGRLKTRIKSSENGVVINRFLPTTKQCPACFNLVKLSLNERTFKCTCGFCEPRDLKSAKTVLTYALFNKDLTSKELRSLPVEALVSMFSNYIRVTQITPKKQEAISAIAELKG